MSHRTRARSARDDNAAGIDEAVVAASRVAMAADIGAFVDSTSSADYFGTRNSRRTRPSLAPICERN